MTKAKNWPRLSETLPHRGARFVCNQCCMAPSSELSQVRDLHRLLRGKPEDVEAAVWIDAQLLEVWQECDDDDQREPIMIVLCAGCSARLIEPHPRLYVELRRHRDPAPGLLAICAGCQRAEGNGCQAAQLYGGDGVRFTPEPSVMFIDGTDKRGRRTGSRRRWFEPAQGCDQRRTAPAKP